MENCKIESNMSESQREEFLSILAKQQTNVFTSEEVGDIKYDAFFGHTCKEWESLIVWFARLGKFLDENGI